MSIWLQLALAIVPLGGLLLGGWKLVQYWLAKHEGKTEQALSDKLDQTTAENAMLKEVAKIDEKNRSLTPDQLDRGLQ